MNQALEFGAEIICRMVEASLRQRLTGFRPPTPSVEWFFSINRRS